MGNILLIFQYFRRKFVLNIYIKIGLILGVGKYIEQMKQRNEGYQTNYPKTR